MESNIIEYIYGANMKQNEYGYEYLPRYKKNPQIDKEEISHVILGNISKIHIINFVSDTITICKNQFSWPFP